MRFLVDAQLPPRLSEWFQSQGHESRALRDIGLRDATDSGIWEFALENDWIIVTKDEDFAGRVAQTESGPQIVWLRIGNSSNEILLKWLEPLWPDVVASLQSGARIVEVQRRG